MSFDTDESLANELVLFTENDGDIYRSQTLSVLKNLASKKASGKYDRNKAIQAFMYLAETGAKEYIRQHGSPGDIWHQMFPTNVRRTAAVKWRDEFEEEFKLGNFDHLVPKKYQSPPKAHIAKRTRAGTWHSSGTEKERNALARDLMAGVSKSDPLARYEDHKYVADRIRSGAALNTILDLAESSLPATSYQFLRDRTVCSLCGGARTFTNMGTNANTPCPKCKGTGTRSILKTRTCPDCGGSGNRATARSASGRELERHEKHGTPCTRCKGAGTL